MESEVDREMMRRAIRLAMRGRGAVEPNPMVGCIIAKDGLILGEGFHETFGGPHAEPNALTAAGPNARGATAYVTLEPCCHLKKKTPPCVPALIKAGVARVVVGCVDPNPMVAGKGLEQLRESGIEVDAEILGAECRQLNAAFFKQMEQRRPYVTLKWAQSENGKVAGAGGRRVQISNGASRRAVHGLRARSDAILVGIGTALLDDPLLTARDVACGRQPVRMIVDTDLRLPPTSQLARTTGDGAVILYCGESVYRQRHAAVAALESRGVEVCALRENPAEMRGKMGSLSLSRLLDDLGGRSMTHLLVDAGPTLAMSFLNENLADRVWVIRSEKRLEAEGRDAPHINWETSGEMDLLGDRLREYLNPAGSVFYSLRKSADFLAVEG
ncbi:MAG: bifunctional diaminohydroxyphosphoribosylaminopyrimidine deaminase/5-amino-6-(5-phosphoribosylamino)uracil reductase RibD [Tepidisphaeraceae bacterium]|jgi:diaminohydroxyphosphoribosylaminopyrimidine deaminase/5-amino-6-(5-phosphoribosylamino)uracil reductase